MKQPTNAQIRTTVTTLDWLGVQASEMDAAAEIMRSLDLARAFAAAVLKQTTKGDNHGR